MNFYFPNVDPTFLYQRKGTNDDPFLSLQDTNVVSINKITLKEIPNFDDKVKATVVSTGEELTEIGINKHIENSNQFRVDYSVGIAYFHEDLEGLEVTLEYTGMGFMSLSANRIWMESGEDEPIESLQEMLTHADEGIRTLEEVGSLEFKGEYNPNITYRKWNFVRYGNKTYVALREVQGEVPNSSDNWTLVSSGVGWVGVYDENESYSVGDMVADSKSHNLYMSEVENNTSPLSDTNSWSTMVSVDGLVDKVDSKINTLDSQFDTKMTELSTTIDTQTEDFTNQINTKISELDNFFNTSSNELIEYLDMAETEENTRVSNESERQSNEQQRVTNEDDRQEAHQLREVEHANAIDEIQVVTQRTEDLIIQTETVRDKAQEQADRVIETIPKIEGFIHTGEYNPDRQYRKNNFVTYSGSTYQALQDVHDVTPVNRDYWIMVAQKGMDGEGLVSTIDGRLPDENGNINLNGLTVTSVNGQVGDVTIDLNTLEAETPDGAQAKVDLHASQTDNPHRVSKAQVGLGNVIDERQATKEEFDSFADRTNENIGNLFELSTMDQASIVAAVNELYTEIEKLKTEVNELKAE